MVDKSVTIRRPETAEAARPRIEMPEIVRPCELTEEESELLDELTGNEYDRALKCWRGFDARIGLVHEDGVDNLEVLGLEPSEMAEVRKGNYSAITGHDLFLYGHRSNAPFEEEIGWSQGIADIFAKCDGARKSVTDIELIERNEPEEIKERRLANFIENYLRSTPVLGSRNKVVDFRYNDDRLGTAISYNFSSGKIAISPEGLQFDHTFFHEAAHLKTSAYLNVTRLSGSFENDWMLRSSDVYVGDACWDIPDDDDFTKKRIFEDGLLSLESKKNVREDISELTAFTYTVPGYVGWVANESQRLWEKVQLLYDYKYISEEQMADVLEGNYSYIEREWRLIAGEPVSREDAEGMSDGELLEHGLLIPAAAKGVKEDILFFLGTMDHEPCWLRDAAREYPLVAAKIEYLYANRMITGKQFAFLTADEPPGMPDLPYCAQPTCEYARGSFWKSVGCYLDLAVEQMRMITAIMTPL